MVCGDKYFSIQIDIFQLTMLLAFVQTGNGYGKKIYIELLQHISYSYILHLFWQKEDLIFLKEGSDQNLFSLGGGDAQVKRGRIFSE